MTVVASPPSFQSLTRLGWNSNDSGPGGLNPMNADDVTRMFLPRKTAQSSDSLSSLSSENYSSPASSASSSFTTAAQPTQINGPDLTVNGEQGGWKQQKKPARALWPSAKAQSVSGIPNPKPQALAALSSGQSAATAMSAVHQPAPVLPSQNMLQNQQQQKGIRPMAQNTAEPPAVLVLLPMNGTFERKQITVPFFPEMLRIGRQTNAKTVPTPVNGYFDSKVLSRQHAEVWADRNGKIWIRDVKSSNGTFVNGVRLSPENRDSEPHELREHDMLELGIDIVSEDQKSIVHHKVSAKVEHAGIHNSGTSVLDLNFGDIDPTAGGGALGPPFSQQLPYARGRGGSQGSISSNGRSTAPSMSGSNMNALGAQRQMNSWLHPISIEQVVKKLATELKQAKHQSQDLNRTNDFFNNILSQDPSEPIPSRPVEETQTAGQAHEDTNEPNTNGAVPLSIDPLSPFSQPPAPPPQQPLPEKPDVSGAGLADASMMPALKRAETERPRSSPTPSPEKSEHAPSQILSLVEALTSAKKEIESQGERVRQLDEMLQQERKAREAAEERTLRLLEAQPGAYRLDQNGSVVEGASDSSDIIDSHDSALLPDRSRLTNGYTADDKFLHGHATSNISGKSRNRETVVSDDEVSPTSRVQDKLSLLIREMNEMKVQMDRYKHRAEESESERRGLAEMVESIRSGELDVTNVDTRRRSRTISETSTQIEAKVEKDESRNYGMWINPSAQIQKARQNGKAVATVSDTEHLHKAVSAALAQTSHQNARLVQSAPYASMVGVLLIGVGIMTYLNGWQKVDR